MNDSGKSFKILDDLNNGYGIGWINCIKMHTDGASGIISKNYGVVTGMNKKLLHMLFQLIAF